MLYKNGHVLKQKIGMEPKTETRNQQNTSFTNAFQDHHTLSLTY